MRGWVPQKGSGQMGFAQRGLSELREWGHMTAGHRLFCKECPCFNTLPCRHMPLHVHFWGYKSPACCNVCFKCARVATFCNGLTHLSMRVDHRRLRHFCDDPVCPEAVTSDVGTLTLVTTMDESTSCHGCFINSLLLSGGCRCALVGVPWRWSISARLAWGDTVSFSMLSKVLKMPSTLRRQGAPMRAHQQLPDGIPARSSRRRWRRIEQKAPTWSDWPSGSHVG